MPLVGTLAAVSARGFGLGTEDMFGEQTFTTPGTYTFYVPAGVTSLSVVSVGGGGGGRRGARYTDSTNPNTITVYSPIPGSLTANYYSGGGGALAYKNSISVTPGQAITVVVGVGGSSGNGGDSTGGDSYLENSGGTKLVHAGGGVGGSSGAGGTVLVGDGGGAGGSGGNWSYSNSSQPEEKVFAAGGGGGAGGYSGAGGSGGNVGSNGSNGSGGGAGGGGAGVFAQYVSGNYTYYVGIAGAAGGGVGILGSGSNGGGGIKPQTPYNFTTILATGGGGGSLGTAGGDSYRESGGQNDTNGLGLYGGGGGNSGSYVRVYNPDGTFQCSAGFAGSGQSGAVRIIWTTNPTITRAFPSTNVGQL